MQRSVVITGTSNGFGRETATAFLGDGWRVYATMRSVHGSNAGAARDLGTAGATVVELDVTDQASVDRAASQILADAGTVDVLVNNAGTAHFGVLESFTPEDVEKQYATNVVGPLRVNRAFLPAMRERKSGLIVYVSSVVGRFVIPFGGLYASSKWAIEALAESSSYELAPLGIDVALVQPGAYPTNIGNVRSEPSDAARAAGYGAVMNYAQTIFGGLEQAAEGRDPGEVARAVLALANQPAGSRPLRTPVPADPGVEAINAATAPIQREILEHFGLGALLPKVAI